MLHGIMGIVTVGLLFSGNVAGAAVLGMVWALKIAHDARGQELQEDGLELAGPTHYRRNAATII